MAHAHLQPVDPGELDGPSLQHFCALVRELKHFFISDLWQAASVGDEARVGGVNAVDVGVDVATLRSERDCERDRTGVTPAPAKRRDLGSGGALETGHDDNPAVVQLL